MQGTTVGFFLGVNALITDAVANIAPIGVAREYHNWGWLGNNYSDQPYPQIALHAEPAELRVELGRLLLGLQSMGVSGLPAVQGPAPWVDNSALRARER